MVSFSGKLIGQNVTDEACLLKGNQTSNLGGNQAGGDGKDDKDKKVRPFV
jgi:hypothetical protein